MQSKKQKEKKKLKQVFKEVAGYIKRPAFLITFIITWLLLESPLIFGLFAYIFTRDAKWWALVIGWFSLTAAPLPVPVLPISVAAGASCERLVHKIKEKQNGERKN